MRTGCDYKDAVRSRTNSMRNALFFQNRSQTICSRKRRPIRCRPICIYNLTHKRIDCDFCKKRCDGKSQSTVGSAPKGISNIEQRTSNVEGSVQFTFLHFDIPCSLFDIHDFTLSGPYMATDSSNSFDEQTVAHIDRAGAMAGAGYINARRGCGRCVRRHRSLTANRQARLPVRRRGPLVVRHCRGL